MKVTCRTNLDLMPHEEWPTELPALPRVGDIIESGKCWGLGPNTFKLRLKVVRVTFVRYYIPDEWIPEIELHDAWCVPRSIRAFYEWYAPHVGQCPSHFI